MSDEITQVQEQEQKKKSGGCCISIILILAVVVIVFMFTRNKGNPETNNLRKELQQKYGISVDKTVINDKTGKWRLARYASNTPTNEFIIDYYKAFFESNDEIHNIINFTLNTTTCVRYTSGVLSFEIHERVPNEELDAKTLGSGILYGAYLAYPDTGVIEEIE